ncbi:unnamed protein product [Lasius platythorax]|uniref:Uncharacterized protein n=1 Tax=Lasius platythorax TaxID=488582 RepID=A0AAV2MY72_9HYME
MRTMWQKVNRTEIFFKKYEEWLNAPVFFPVPATSQKTPTNKGGRFSTEFASCSDRSKRRKTEEIRATLTSNELAYATQMSLRSAGQLDASKIVKEATLTSPLRASRYRKAFQSTTENTLSEDAALSVLVEFKLSKSQYQGLRSVSKENHCKLYPPYKKVTQAKSRCYPPCTAINITESSAEVHLQALLDHTVERILFLQNDVIRSLSQKCVSNMNFICKWGCDGSSGQSQYKQTFNDDSISDANVFFTSVVPLQLISVNHESKAQIVVWKNPRPSFSSIL